jgi:hypothetical protein
VIHVIHNPLCTAVSSASYRSKIQKAAHLRKSYSIVDSVHPISVHTVSRGDEEQVISFSDNDLKDVQLSHNDPLVVTLRIGNYDVQRILIDQGSFAEVMYHRSLCEARLGGVRTVQFHNPHIRLFRRAHCAVGKNHIACFSRSHQPSDGVYSGQSFVPL